MREIMIALFSLVCYTGVSHAAGLSTLIEKADPRAITIVSIVFGMLALAILGILCSMITKQFASGNRYDFYRCYDGR